MKAYGFLHKKKVFFFSGTISKCEKTFASDVMVMFIRDDDIFSLKRVDNFWVIFYEYLIYR